MELAANFSFQPLDNDEGAAPPPAAAAGQGLGPLAGLAGSWSGRGFNAIWRPHRGPSDHFLELNVTSDQIDVTAINGQIPNRGLVTAQIFLQGLTYLQQISDANVEVGGAPAGLHIEPGVWINIPPTTDPGEQATIARMASIPHGTTILIQGTATTAAGGPTIGAASLTPFSIGDRKQPVDFAEQHLNQTTQFRTSGVGLTGITQAMLDNPNSVLTGNPPKVSTTTTLHVSTTAGTIVGGGTANTAFLVGTKDGPNADAAHVAATFWLQKLEGDTEPKRLQYSQTVLLNFAGLSWPHITVATLTKA
ncbi:MAG TPA: heme-binding protein [Streptosporangiaceae bacterium]|nr:heme-binding protein [Streptosporangiaceae bacterium]